jgi:hypothetical protein
LSKTAREKMPSLGSTEWKAQTTQCLGVFYRMETTAAADAHSLGVGSETLQILGQIVADRASGAALDIARERMLVGFCGEEKSEEAEEDKAATAEPRLEFPRACAVVRAVRIQDLATSGRVLIEATIADVLEALANDAGLKEAEKAALSLVIKFIVPEVIAIAEGGGSSTSTSLVARRAIEMYVTEILKQPTLTRGQQAVVVAGMTLAGCIQDHGATLRSCPIAKIARDMSSNFHFNADAETLFAAERLATQVIETLTAGTVEESDWQARMKHAADAIFEGACLSLPGQTELQICSAAVPTSRPKTAVAILSAARYLLEAAIDRDANALISGLIGMKACGTSKPCEKGIRIAGTVLQYARTYKNGDGETAHAERVKLLEDLSSDMTDRIGREDEFVWSLGGSLQLVGGYRAAFDNDHEDAFWGPVALPLGLGLQHVGGGFHMQLNVFDLGQYLSWEAGPKVAEPEIEDALSPSLTVGYAWGTSFPAFVAATAGYTPSYRPADDANRRGSVNFGATVGIYVPLLDIN